MEPEEEQAMNRGRPVVGGLVAACLAAVAYLLMTAPAEARLVSAIHTTLEDFNAGSLFHTGLTRHDDGEVQLLVVGLAGDWITETNTSGLPALDRHSAVHYNGHILVLGGRKTNLQASDQVYYTTIDPTDHDLADWQTTTPLPTAQYPSGLFSHASVVVGNRVYVLGGFDNSTEHATVSFATIQPQGTLEGTWHSTTSLPRPLELLQATVVDGRIYVVGGRDSGGARAEVYFAEPNLDTGAIVTWTQTMSFAHATVGHMMANYGGRIFVLGGTHPTLGVTPYTDFATIDPASGHITSWTRITNMERNIYGGAGLAFSGQLYTTGGAENILEKPSQYVASTLIGLDGQIASWRQTSLIEPERFFHAAVRSTDGWLYVINGNDGSGPIQSINRGPTSGPGETYAEDGTFTSPVLDLGSVNRLVELSWNATISDTSVMSISMRYRTRMAAGDAWSAWFGPYPSSSTPGTVTSTVSLEGSARFVQYEASLRSSDTRYTPALNAVRLVSNFPTYEVQISKDSVPPPGSNVYPGAQVSYTLTYSNSIWGITATNVYIVDAPPEHTSYVPGSIHGEGKNDNDPALLRWALGTVAPGERGTVGYTVVITNALTERTTLQNRATITSTGQSDRFSNWVTHTINIWPLELQFTKNSVPPQGSQVTPGSLITYTLHYTNSGLLPASRAVLTEAYDFHSSYSVLSTDPLPDEGNHTWQLGRLAPDEEGQIEIVVQLTDTLPNHWPIVNLASLSSPERSAPFTDVVTHTVLYSGVDLADLYVEDIHWEPAEPQPDTPIVFHATIVNTGTLDANHPFWVALYIKPSPSDPPLGPWDHDQGYCLDGCSITRPQYLYYVVQLLQGKSIEIWFSGDDLKLPEEGTYDIYVQADVSFDHPDYNPSWGIYAEEYESNNIGHEQAVCAGPPKIYLPAIYKNSP
jgi:uncharacterized repeat protein (TIGR01451 family)